MSFKARKNVGVDLDSDLMLMQENGKGDSGVSTLCLRKAAVGKGLVDLVFLILNIFFPYMSHISVTGYFMPTNQKGKEEE